jgi:hypothetical protein
VHHASAQRCDARARPGSEREDQPEKGDEVRDVWDRSGLITEMSPGLLVSGSQSSDPNLLVADSTRTKQTVWTEDQFTVTAKDKDPSLIVFITDHLCVPFRTGLVSLCQQEVDKD